MAEVNIVKIDGKPLEKLIDVISKGIGTVYRPRAIRKEAEAKAYEIEILERAKAKAIAEGNEIDADSYERMQDRLLYRETRRQVNIDNVTQIAADQLNQDDEVSDEPVAADWSTRFFNIVEDVSDEEMQNLWGRILAGEVKRPKSYSLRTLELLKNLSKEEADIFVKFANARLDCRKGKHLIFNNDNGKFIKDEFKITFEDRLLMSELGLISSENSLALQFQPTKTPTETSIGYGNKVILLSKGPNCPAQSIKALAFTKAGIELAQLIEQTPNEKYIKIVCAAFKNPAVKTEYADVMYGNDGMMSLTNIIEIH